MSTLTVAGIIAGVIILLLVLNRIIFPDNEKGERRGEYFSLMINYLITIGLIIGYFYIPTSVIPSINKILVSPITGYILVALSVVALGYTLSVLWKIFFKKERKTFFRKFYWFCFFVLCVFYTFLFSFLTSRTGILD